MRGQRRARGARHRPGAAGRTDAAPSMSGTLALASLIASLDREGLHRLVRARRISSPAAVSDALDLAAELLRSDSIVHALAGSSREELAALAFIGDLAADRPVAPAPDVVAGLVARGLAAGGDGSEAVLFATELPEVTRSLESLLAARGLTADDLAAVSLAANETAAERADPPGPETPSSSDTSSWYAAALTAIAQCAWLLRELAKAPAHLNRSGVVASLWAKAVEERLAVPRAAELVPVLCAARLAEARGTELVANTEAEAATWLAAEPEGRWIALAIAAVSLMPPQALGLVVERARVDPPAHSLADLAVRLEARYPLATETLIRAAERAAALWERLGLTVGGVLSPVGLSTLGLAPAPEPGSLGLPDRAHGVYLQPDLTIVVPGPLAAAEENTLAAFTAPEQLGVASTLRATEATLAEALERGMRADDIRAFLERITLTGIPQPLEYLITTLGERARSVVVSPHTGDEGRSRIDFARAELRATMLVDRGLAHLQLHEAGGESSTSGVAAPLFSRLRADHVLAALLDARYPAAGSGIAEAADPPPARAAARGRQADEAVDRADPLDALVDRVLAASSDGPSDIGRQVALAIRDRSPIRVTVEMRGEARDFTIVPVSLAAGRMRALDEAAGVERTLPLDAITAVATLG